MIMQIFHTLLSVILFTNAVIGASNFSGCISTLSQNDKEFLNKISDEEWLQYLHLGTDSVQKQKRLEENLLESRITVNNGSISHVQLLDTLPNERAKEDCDVALKILRSSLYVYNLKCTEHRINGKDCETYLADKKLPTNSELLKKCTEIILSRRNGHHPYRRLLPRKYKDGFYEMYSENEVPSPRTISCKAFQDWEQSVSKELFDNNQKSLALVQWSQFIEHDLSKPVVTLMSNGEPIECCNKDNYKLAPRFKHPACAPLLGRDPANTYGMETCLSYVRSALAVGSKCTFGSIEQLNQATGDLDLSQLYGFSELSQKRMRLFKDGKIKSSHTGKIHQELLPIAKDDFYAFCAQHTQSKNSSCFLAGDSRVNSNPFAILIYTIFMRNHNHLASKLKLEHSNWSDEKIFSVAKTINVDIYRRIVFDEWLSVLLGDSIANEVNINKKSPARSQSDEMYQISNEFGVAAMRFYFSMMPNSLHNFAASKYNVDRVNAEVPTIINNAVLFDSSIFVLKDQIFKPDLLYTYSKLNDILESLLNQLAMRMDANYVESLIWTKLGSVKSLHTDLLAFDIQRGRDHGLQGYVKYVEICNGVKVSDWKDLERFITKQDILKLKEVYKSWSDIDLIIGGISEIPANGSTVGPTFTCILAEQFTRIRQGLNNLVQDPSQIPELLRYKSITAVNLLCANSDLKYVPKNIFVVASEKNPLVSCADHLAGLRN